jgi:hypothetical protein
LPALLYFLTKFLAYIGWMYLGLRLLRSGTKASIAHAFFLGLLRLFLGLIFGVVIYLLGSAMLSQLGYGSAANALTYLSVYVPVRWLEWSIMAALLLSPSISQFLFGTGKTDRLWRAGGIVVSCLADVPLIISLGGVIPTGRFLC